jgi:Secretion system C-terminal sorting domain
MKEILKIAFFCCLFFCSFSFKAQSNLQDYLSTENLRTIKADSIEVEIEQFISNNIGEFDLAPSLIDEILLSLDQDDHEGTNHIVTETELEDLFLEYKKAELRKMFFIQNPEKHAFFSATIPPIPLQLTCINGGFEIDTNTSYTFFSQVVLPPGTQVPFGCNVNINTGNFVPSGINNFQARATRVNQGNEPLMASLNPPIFINRVNNVNGGNFSLKINPTPANPPGNTSSDGEIGNITSVNSSPFIIDQNAIEFNFLLIGKVVPLNQHNQPTFRYMLVDANTNAVLRNVCITMNANDCRFTTVPDTRPGWTNPSFGVINYTPQWVCERINTANLINRNVRLIFQVSDCQRRGHFATVYIDNLCGVTCNPTWGTININPVNIQCPTSPFQICGDFQMPDLNTNIGNITMNILNQFGNQVGPTLSNPTISGQTYCFTVDPAIFGVNPSENYTFQVNSTLVNTTSCANPNILTSTNGSLSFANCCQPTLVLTSADNMTNIFPNSVKHRERSNWISASNIIGIGNNAFQNGVVYHAGNFVELTPGFDAINDSQFVAYVEGCSTNYEYRYQNSETYQMLEFEEEKINLVKAALKDFSIIPNPSSYSIEILTSNIQFNKIEIISIEGRKVFETTVENTDKTQIDISNYNNGIYIVTVTDVSGQQFSQKLIKN